MSRKPGFQLSEEHKQKISAALRGKIPGSRLPHSEETKKKIGNSNKGRLLGFHRSEETKARISAALQGKPKPPVSEETRKRISESKKGKLRSPLSIETRQKISKANQGRYHTAEAKEKMSLRHKGKHLSAEHKAAISFAIKAKMTPEYLKQMSEESRRRWCSVEFQSKMKKAWLQRPTTLEKAFTQILDGIVPGKFRYTGDFSFWVEGKNPDFACLAQQKVIEVFGSFWHKQEDEASRIAHYLAYGWHCLVIWDNELIDKEKINQKVLQFSNEP